MAPTGPTQLCLRQRKPHTAADWLATWRLASPATTSPDRAHTLALHSCLHALAGHSPCIPTGMDRAQRDDLTTTATADVANSNTQALVRRDTFERRMAIEVSVVRALPALRALAPECRALAGSAPGARFPGPDWLLPWWLAYHNTLAAELHVMVGRATEADATGTAIGDIVFLAPLYRRTVKVALL